MRTAILCAASALALSIGTSAQAQSAAEARAEAGDSGIQEIVVTAQKRSENAQKVPIAISAFSSETISERAVGSIAQLSALSPGVNLDAGTPFSGSTAVLSAFIRGIGSDDFAFNIDPGVGIYVDGVYLARTVGANQDLLDVQRVEILKGPQGTLFGRNTIGGAISIVTRNPSEEFSFKGDITTGRFNLIQARGTADLPITPDLTSSVTFGIKHRNGYVQRVRFNDPRVTNTASYTSFPSSDFDTASREGGDNNWNLRGKLHWDGGDVKVTIAGDYTRENSTGLANTLLTTASAVPGPFAGLAGLPGTAFDPSETTGFLFAGLYNFCIGATSAQIAARNAQALCGVRGTQFNTSLRQQPIASVNVDGNSNNDLLPYDNRFVSNDIDKSYATGNSFSHLTNWGLGGTVEWQLAPEVTIKSITAYREMAWKSGMDADGTPLNFLQLSFEMNQWQFSQELQVLGSFLDDKLKYVLGAYYFKEKGDLHDYVTFAEGLLQVDGPNALQTENHAFFGQLDYRPIDLIGVTFGGRYTHETKLFEGGQQDLNGFNYKLFGCSDPQGNITPNGPFPLAPISCQTGLSYPDPNNPLRVYAPGVNRQKFSDFSPKVGIQLYPTDRIMAYASWSKGYKTGGWTTRLTNPQLLAQPFAEEKATTWEIGAKTNLLNNRLQFNVAAFTTSYKGIQLNFQQGTSPTIRNAGDARIKGFEAEFIAAPLRNFTLSGSISYTDAYYTSVLPGVLAVSGPNAIQAGTSAGADLPKTPEWKINLSPRYEAQLGNGGSFVIIADWTHASSVWNNAQRTLLLRRPSTDVINASVTYRAPGDNWSLTVGGTNLTDERYLTTGNANIAAGTIYGTYSRPAEWYARLGVKF